MTFYRGGWCPYCNLQLRAYQAILPEITALGARLVAISPQLPDGSLSTAEVERTDIRRSERCRQSGRRAVRPRLGAARGAARGASSRTTRRCRQSMATTAGSCRCRPPMSSRRDGRVALARCRCRLPQAAGTGRHPHRAELAAPGLTPVDANWRPAARRRGPGWR